jgi:hypothetical protein
MDDKVSSILSNTENGRLEFGTVVVAAGFELLVGWHF